MNPTIPRRHPSTPRPVPAAIKAFALVLGLREPTTSEFRRLGECLTVGDEPMDRLVEWMYSTGMSQTRPLFEQALTGGIDSVPHPPEPLREFFVAVEKVPDRVDWNKLRRAELVMRSGGVDGMYIARDIALQGGYMFAGFNQTLLRTGALEKGSNKRFAETLQWAMDVISDDGMAPLGIGYRSTIRVRLIHAFVRRHVGAMADWRSDEWGLPINQTDMAATLVGALIAPTAGALGMGMLNRPADLDAVAHLTRYVGWLIGVQDDYLPTSFRDGMRVLYHTLSALSSPDETTKQLAVPMAEDPLSWHYRRLSTLRRRVAKSQHLSMTSAFLGPSAMRSLGLPPFVLPWYPLVRIPVNLTRSVTSLVLPGGLVRAAVRGERAQAQFMRTISNGGATVGASATHIGQAA
ncbi:oxygenase MpaB family protein [Antrihabitans sp. YC2-6]|uniref:oxygenase MpaB family protein n=1 Tax=Antrihabitans sp. YC2-6 TaxID=2799498 RepID=UPI0018F5DC84|nr:oxygenase MpaB family protein [Antrihabitans sp. YC2-6]MBJ8348340.1 DUF2236 domain-containing protein [Antrihabitans sp. YC2-6]